MLTYIGEVQWHSPQSNFSGNIQDINNEIKIQHYKKILVIQTCLNIKVLFQYHSMCLLYCMLLQAIRVFFLLRNLSLTLRQEQETQLPLTKQDECVKVNDVLDLSKS